MWNLRLPGGVPSRHYSTFSDSLGKMPPTSGFFATYGLGGLYAGIPAEKRFENPNFVNKQNPNIHSCQAENATPKITEKCVEFFNGISNSDAFKLTESLQNTQMPESTTMKENTKRNNRRQLTKKLPSKKTTKHSLSSPRKNKSNKSNMNSYLDIDEVGVDVLNDYDSDCDLPYENVRSEILISSSPMCISIGTPEQQPAFVISINTPNVNHRRMPSDCGSEDSFIEFRHSPGDESDLTELESETDSDDDDSDDSCYSGAPYSLKTDEDVSGIPFKPHKKVRFSDDLCEIHPMVQWNYAYRAARKGPWEEYARDRERFKCRIAKVGEKLNFALQPGHRRKIYEERFAEKVCDK